MKFSDFFKRKEKKEKNNDSINSNQVKQQPQQDRNWKSNDGKFSVDAKYVSFDQFNGNVSLLKQNGIVINVPFGRFSTEDQDYINKLTGSEYYGRDVGQIFKPQDFEAQPKKPQQQSDGRPEWITQPQRFVSVEDILQDQSPKRLKLPTLGDPVTTVAGAGIVGLKQSVLSAEGNGMGVEVKGVRPYPAWSYDDATFTLPNIILVRGSSQLPSDDWRNKEKRFAIPEKNLTKNLFWDNQYRIWFYDGPVIPKK